MTVSNDLLRCFGDPANEGAVDPNLYRKVVHRVQKRLSMRPKDISPADWTSFLSQCSSKVGDAKLQQILHSVLHEEIEHQVVAALSWVRQNPRGTAALIARRLPLFDGKSYEVRPNVRLATKEGPAALQIAIRWLKAQQPLDNLKSANEEGLRLSCEDHACDVGATGATSHTGSAGSTPDQRANRYGKWSRLVGEALWFGQMNTGMSVVLDLVIDDGVPDRGHRDSIYTASFKVAGVRVQPHVVYGSVVAILFANDYTGDSAKISRRDKISTSKIAPPARQVAADTPSWGSCVRCKKRITDAAVMSTDKGKWHKSCFTCTHCKRPLQGCTFNLHDGEEYCSHCYTEKCAPRCEKCRKAVGPKWLVVNGRTYHPECR